MCQYAGLAVVVGDAPASWQGPHRVFLVDSLFYAFAWFKAPSFAGF
jgi:hypothetical protein